MTGVCPRGAHVRRVTGSSEAPDSSQNTMAALRRRAAARILGPVLGHPAGNRPLVALDGAAGGALQAVAHAVAQQLPGVAGMVGDPGQLLDHRRDSGKGPVVGVEAVREGAFAQRLVNGGKLLVGQARGGAGRAGAAERVLPALAPTGVPAADDLPGHTQLVGDLGLGVAGGKQLPGLHADAFERLAVAQTTGVAAVGGWSHPAMLPGQPRSCHRKGRASFKATVRGSSPWRRTPQNPQVSPRCTAGAFYVHSLRLGTFGHARDAVGWIIRAGRTFRRDTVCRSVECDGGEVAAAVELYGPKAASASPRKSSNSTLSGTPGVSWVNSWLPIPVSPPADPGSTLTAPANSKEPTVSPSTPTARSTKPSSPKAPAASAMPNPSRNSALSSTPGLSWVNSWLPAPVNPPAEPGRTLTAPAPAMSPSCSPTPTARSAKLSPSKSPTASASPKPSPGSATPGTPGLFWVNSWLPIPVSPPAEPRRVLTAPASSAARTSSALPTARSTKRSPSKSPTAKAMPRLSPNSAAPGTPGLSWVNSWLPIPVSPPADPESTLTAPPRSLAPKSSPGAPTAKSTKRSPSKSPAPTATPNSSSGSTRPTTPGLSWVNSWLPAPVSPPAEPYSTFTAPASTTAPTSSNDTPTARSAKPSPSKSPTASASPKPSPSSAAPGTPVSCVKSWLPAPVSPLAVPYSTFTAPPLPMAPRFSPATPTARSAKPSLLKSARRPSAACLVAERRARPPATGQTVAARSRTRTT